MIKVYRSNRLEQLATLLSAQLSQPKNSPLQPETVIVQSNGMSRWLSMWMADLLGVSANVNFPLPASLIWKLFQASQSAPLENRAWDTAHMSWRLMQLLPEKIQQPGFESLRDYLQDADDLLMYQLAWRIADLYDQYLVYRPDWILQWEAGEEVLSSDPDERWQAELWRALVALEEKPHRAQLQQHFFQRLSGDLVRCAGLGERLFLFSISAVPPVYLEVFNALSEQMEVHLFLLDPCEQFWGDIIDRKTQSRLLNRSDGERLYLERGNTLLASWGKQGRDTFDQLLAFDPEQLEAYESPLEEVDSPTLLQHLQEDLLSLQDRPLESGSMLLQADDLSLQIHSCHSPLREVEVLHDQLLRLFDQDPTLKPRDVMVMGPLMAQYGSLIEAVFASAPRERRIPFSIADRSYADENRLLDDFFLLLDLLESRYEVSRLLALLESGALQKRFGLRAEQLPQIQMWLEETQIRWGIDGQDRQAMGLPDIEQHSWMAGLERMLLGYALPGGEQNLFAEVLPYDEIEGESAQLLGSLAKLMRHLVALKRELSGALTVDEWQLRLRQLLEDFFVIDDDNEQNAYALSAALAQLASSADDVAFEQPVSLSVVRGFLLSELERNQRTVGFISGQVTFCSMVPMRSIPARVICLLGMNDDDYPRRNTQLSFDLMSKDFRRGDRSRRDDDRYLFLESLISTRDIFYLSYVGQDIQQNTPRPPSVLINELLDYIQHGFVLEGEASLQSHLVTKHPLQPFSPRYFSQQDKQLFSYATEMKLDLSQVSSVETPFFAAPLVDLAEEWRELAWPQLLGFFRHPVRFLCQQRLGLQLGLSNTELEDQEPFDLDPLQQYQLRERMLGQLQGGADEALVQQLQAAASHLPHGLTGELVFEHSFQRVEPFYQRLVGWQLPTLEPLEIDLQIKSIHLSGWLSGVTKDGLQRYFVGKLSGKRLLEVWLQHLILSLIAAPEQCCVSHLLCEDREVTLQPVDNAEHCLQELLALFATGLTLPLKLFPNLAFSYLETVLAEEEKEQQGKKSKSAAELLEQRRKQWFDEWTAPSEASDRYHLLVFKKANPIDAEFQALAERVFEPILAVAKII